MESTVERVVSSPESVAIKGYYQKLRSYASKVSTQIAENVELRGLIKGESPILPGNNRSPSEAPVILQGSLRERFSPVSNNEVANVVKHRLMGELPVGVVHITRDHVIELPVGVVNAKRDHVVELPIGTEYSTTWADVTTNGNARLSSGFTSQSNDQFSDGIFLRSGHTKSSKGLVTGNPRLPVMDTCFVSNSGNERLGTTTTV